MMLPTAKLDLQTSIYADDMHTCTLCSIAIVILIALERKPNCLSNSMYSYCKPPNFCVPFIFAGK